MATCYDCIHCEACSDAGDLGFSSLKEDVSKCKHFKNKADFVEVVRCKDCKHATFYSCKNDACYKAIICECKIGIGDENFYCACAEPRTPKEREVGEK